MAYVFAFSVSGLLLHYYEAQNVHTFFPEGTEEPSISVRRSILESCVAEVFAMRALWKGTELQDCQQIDLDQCHVADTVNFPSECGPRLYLKASTSNFRKSSILKL